LRAIWEKARAENIAPHRMADRTAEERLASAPRARSRLLAPIQSVVNVGPIVISGQLGRPTERDLLSIRVDQRVRPLLGSLQGRDQGREEWTIAERGSAGVTTQSCSESATCAPSAGAATAAGSSMPA